MQDKGVSTGIMDLSFSSFSFFPHGQTLHFFTWKKNNNVLKLWKITEQKVFFKVFNTG